MNRVGRHRVGTMMILSAITAVTFQSAIARGQEKKNPVTKVLQPKAKTKPGRAKELLPPGVKPGRPGVPEPTVVLKPGEAPQVKFDTPVYDFGRLKAGGDVRHDYWFTNTGTGPLEILKVKPSCGCTTAGSHDRIVQPGERGKIPIKMGTEKFNGPVNKTVTVHTNATGKNARITLKIQGNVWQVFGVTPNRAVFGRVNEDDIDQTRETRITITNNTESPANLTNIRSSNPTFSAKANTIQPGKQFELVVSAGNTAVPGANTGEIKIDTGHADKPTIKVPISLYVAPAVDVTPAKLMLPSVRSSNTKRNLYVRNNSKEPLTLSDVQVPNPGLKATIEETRPGGKAYRVVLEIPQNYKPAKGDKISIKTSNSKVPMLTVPIKDQSASRTVRNQNGKYIVPKSQAPLATKASKDLAIVKKGNKPAAAKTNKEPAKPQGAPSN
ncbi:MAG: DUF1573 domain-containing protein [Phycisphaerales bacterium]|nr:DUF1573 domain-containing protein [Phycisphaerales bacterium]